MPRAQIKSTRADQILEVATELFFTKGYGHVGVDEIGSAAGLSGPAIYRHFKGKGEILAALFDQAIDGLLSVTGSTQDDDPKNDLARRIRVYAGYVLSQDKLASVWIREGRSLSGDHRTRLRRRERNYISQWVLAVQNSYPSLSAEQSEVAALTVLGTLNSLPSWPRPLGSDDTVAAVTSFVLSGLEKLGDGAWGGPLSTA